MRPAPHARTAAVVIAAMALTAACGSSSDGGTPSSVHSQIVLGGGSGSNGAEAPELAVRVSRPTSAAAQQVLAAVKAATTATSIPKNIKPPLTDFANNSRSRKDRSLRSVDDCDAYGRSARAAHPKPCLLGDKRGTRTIVIVGDSNVGNWVPALDKGLAHSGYRLAAFAFIGCPASDIHYARYAHLSSTMVDDCNTWHQAVPAAIAALKPVAVVVASGAVDFTGINPDEWVSGFATLFNAATHGTSAVRILRHQPVSGGHGDVRG